MRKIGHAAHAPRVSEVAKPHLRTLIAPAASTAEPCRAARSDDRARQWRGGLRAISAHCRASRGYRLAQGRDAATAEARDQCCPRQAAREGGLRATRRE